MTSVIIPDFILKIFEKEITKINVQVVEVMCKKFNINVEDAKQMLAKELKINFNIITEEIEQMKIVKKNTAVSKKSSNTQNAPVRDDKALTSKVITPSTHIDGQTSFCDARVYIPSELIVKQCSRSKFANCKFCKMHQKHYDEGKLKYGTVFDAKPAAISTPALNLKVKRKLY